MSKIIVMQGLPGSGKTTIAREMMKNDGNVVRVGRDQLRAMLHFDVWNGKNEDLTKKAQLAVVKAMLDAGKVVLIDDTTIQQSRIDFWKNFIRENQLKADWIMLDTDLATCIQRDALREHPIGREVITAMALQAGLYPKPAKGFIICDLDGTLADVRHRLPFVQDLPEGQKKDWKSFFEAIPGDSLRVDVVDMVMKFEQEGHEIILVSARPDTYREVTEIWLEKVFQGYRFWTTLLMRRAGDRRPDTETKQQILDTYFTKPGYPIHCVIDDRPSVIEMWRANNLKVIDVGEGKEF